MPAPRQNRIDRRFALLASQGRKAFVAYITAGDPDLKSTAALAHALEQAGADVIELGVPFSDPLADGVVNQLAAERALRAGTTLDGIFLAVAEMRRCGLTLPVVLFTYFNPIHRYGPERFLRRAAACGMDGVLHLDAPLEEAKPYFARMERAGLHTIQLIAPTTDAARVRRIAQAARGFIYYVSREGVTGVQSHLAVGISQQILEIRRHARTPVVVGFGISTPAQVRAASQLADGCVVGSAIVQRIGKMGRHKDLAANIGRFVRKLTAPLRA